MISKIDTPHFKEIKRESFTCPNKYAIAMQEKVRTAVI